MQGPGRESPESDDSLMLERPAVYVMRRVSSGPLLTLSFLDMARVIPPWKLAGGGVPSSSCASTLLCQQSHPPLTRKYGVSWSLCMHRQAQGLPYFRESQSIAKAPAPRGRLT